MWLCKDYLNILLVISRFSSTGTRPPGKCFFFFFAVALPGLFRPDVVHQTFFVIGSPGSAGPQQKKKHVSE